MSYDLMVFDNTKAPLEREEFMHWYSKKTSWSEEMDFDNHENASPDLQAFFIDLIKVYPPLNGKLAPNDECWDDSDWCEKFEDKCTDYSIGTDIIYCAFAWSEAAQALKTVKELARKHRVGFFNVSSNGEVLYNEARASSGKGHAFELDWGGVIYTDSGNGSLNADVIWDAINGFSLKADDYIILEPTPAIKQSIYMQSHSPEEDGMIPVEIRFEYEDGSFKHYVYSCTDKKEIYHFFINYWSKRELPDLTNWSDITDEF